MNQPQYQPPAPAPKGASGLYIRLADLVIVGGALILLLFSFGPVVGFSDLNPLAQRELSNAGTSLWSWLSPLGLFVLLATLLLLASAAVDTWWKRDRQMVGLHRHHIQVGLALFVLFALLGMCFADPYSGLGLGAAFGFGISWGGVIQLFGALIMAAGAILNHFSLLQNPIAMPKPAPAVAPQAYPGAPAGGYTPPVPPQSVPPSTVPTQGDSVV